MDSVERFLQVIADEVRSNPSFRARLEEALSGAPRPEPQRLSARRTAATIDVFAVYRSEGAAELRRQLETLDVERLKDIVAEHGMDHSRLALKWRRPERLVDLIVSAVEARLTKGDVFR